MAGPNTERIFPALGPSRAAPSPHLVADNAGHEQQLSRVVELEIIPRLLLMHGAMTQAVPVRAPLQISQAHVATLADLAVDDDGGSALRFVQALVQAGATADQVLLDLLAPCARLMGDWWCSDLFNFSQVTVGLWRLQQVLHEQGRALRPALQPGAPRALFAAPPGSQHTFGAALVAELFANAGWEVDYEPGRSWDELAACLAARPHILLGLSISADVSPVSVGSAIVALRRASCVPGLRVMVGGPLALVDAELASRCGADGQAADARDALRQAAQWAAVRKSTS